MLTSSAVTACPLAARPDTRSTGTTLHSEGMHPDSYLLVVEDAEVMIPNVTASTNPRVRSDVVYLPYEGGGAVFSVGSCSWCGSLSHNSYDNDIYRITDNVLSAFLAPRGVPPTP
jgi:N,N-dimethylformamidase